MKTTGRFFFAPDGALALIVAHRPSPGAQISTVTLDSIDGSYVETGYVTDIRSIKAKDVHLARESAFAAGFLPAARSVLHFTFTGSGSVESWHKESAARPEATSACA